MSLAAFPHEIFSDILEFYVLKTLNDYPDVRKVYHEYLNILLVSSDFHYLANKAIYKYLIVSETSPQTSTIGRLGSINKNKDRLGRILTKLVSHGGLSNSVRRLGLRMQHVDEDLIGLHYRTMTLCGSVTELHLVLHALYDKMELNNILKQLTSLTTVHFYGYNADNKSISPWNIVEIILLVQGCSRLEHLTISLDEWRSHYYGTRREDHKENYSLRSLMVNDVNLYTEELFCISVLLPKLEKFHGSIGRFRDSEEAILDCCRPGRWPSTLTELDLRLNYRACYHSRIGAAICKFSKLTTLRIPAEHLRPDMLMEMLSLENVSYLYAGQSEIGAIAYYFRQSHSLGGLHQHVCLPALKSFKLEHCRNEPGVFGFLTEISQLLEARGVNFEVCPAVHSSPETWDDYHVI